MRRFLVSTFIAALLFGARLLLLALGLVIQRIAGGTPAPGAAA